VEIRGVGKRFSGSYTLSKVTHSIGAGGYQTRFEVTQKAGSTLLQLLRSKIKETPSPNRQEKNYGLVVGIVENNIDPEGLGRVQLSFPHLSDINLSNWARVASPMAGSQKGVYFLPEMRQEVLVAFEQGDVNKPVIIGSLWNGLARPPAVNLGLNEKKLIRMKSGAEILFDETPFKQSITLTDAKGSMIKMDSLTGDIIIEAKGNVVIKSGPLGKIDLNP
jgi:uncharacterized protein involved in type VI secretion and phage assembly